jgi:hypothetical protein
MGLASSALQYRVLVSCPAGIGPCAVPLPPPCNEGFAIAPYTEFGFGLYPKVTASSHANTAHTDPTTSLTNQYMQDAIECYDGQAKFAAGVFTVAAEADSPEGPMKLWQSAGTFDSTLNGSACKYN